MTRILEIGCGPKDRQINEADGIDLIDFGQLYVGDFMTFKFPMKYDIIFAHHVIEHIQNTVKFFNKVGIVLRRGGMIDIRVPIWPTKYSFIDPTHVKFIVFPEFFYYFTSKSPAGHCYSKNEFEIVKTENDRYDWEGHIIMKKK